VLGRVKWFSARKGFGFLTTADGKEYFVHARSLDVGVVDLREGERVSFELAPNPKGPTAVNVRLAA
jgi:cold shock protein